ncbi:MAG: hypothetical protein P2A85_20990 [Microcoleus anatoxicus]|uniref:hypothetical protein n=1 Tax=Microcoleus anatoxicus TaxID=2705319 RepID=UPI00366ACADE
MGDRTSLFLHQGHGYFLVGDWDYAFQDYSNAIAPRSNEGLLGQDFLARYVRILENQV